MDREQITEIVISIRESYPFSSKKIDRIQKSYPSFHINQTIKDQKKIQNNKKSNINYIHQESKKHLRLRQTEA